MNNPTDIAIVGTGIVGQSWAIAFARAGVSVRLFDHVKGTAERAVSLIEDALSQQVAHGLLAGEAVAGILGRLTPHRDLGATLEGVSYVQESTPELLDIKRNIFKELDALAPADAIVASSTSALRPSEFAAGLPGTHRCLVVHPLNPPHMIPAVEIVPGPDTSPEVVTRAKELLKSIGQSPVVLKTEIAGFVMNRLQGALLDEAFSLVRDGIADIEDIDTAMCAGLARRWTITGPFETIDLNAPGGVAGFLERYRQAYSEIGEHRPDRPEWSGDMAAAVIAECRRARSLDELPERKALRDRRLAALAAHLEQTTREGE